MKSLLHLLLFIKLFHFILEVNSKSISVNNENDLINGFSNNKSVDELTIIINNGILNISNDINLNNNNIKKLIITGESKDNSILNFNNINNGFTFGKSINEIKLNKISIKGCLKFINNINIEIDDVNINGTLDFNNQCSNDQCTNDQSIYINKLDFYSETSSKDYCINLFGNVKYI